MTQVSRRFLKRETEEKINNLFWESISLCPNKTSVAEFLDDLLSPTEKVMLSKRLTIAYLLLKGYPYDVINSTLKVSDPTIGKISLLLKLKGKGLRKALERAHKRKLWRDFFEELADAALDIFGKGKGGNWKAAESFKHQRRLAKQSPI